MAPRVQAVAGPEPDVAAMEPLRANSGPAVDRGEVDQADQRPARRRQVSARQQAFRVDVVTVERSRAHPKDVGVHPSLELSAKKSQTMRIVKLVAVDRED